MERFNSIIIVYSDEVKNYLDKNGVYNEVAESSLHIPAKVIFVKTVSEDILSCSPVFYESDYGTTPIFYFDDSNEEVVVKGNEYKDFDITSLYTTRTGIYDSWEQTI